MNKIIKIGFLVVTLCIPVAIFTFLKIFGNNKFNVEILYQNGVSKEFQDECKIGPSQFYVNTEFIVDSGARLKVVAFTTDSSDVTFNNISKRLNEQFDDKISLHLVSTEFKNFKEYVVTTISTNDFEHFVKCNFILQNVDNLVLIDGNNRIRGYYERDLDEIDRLIVEMKIVLENGNS
jgi:protein SCO1/2